MFRWQFPSISHLPHWSPLISQRSDPFRRGTLIRCAKARANFQRRDSSVAPEESGSAAASPKPSGFSKGRRWLIFSKFRCKLWSTNSIIFDRDFTIHICMYIYKYTYKCMPFLLYLICRIHIGPHNLPLSLLVYSFTNKPDTNGGQNPGRAANARLKSWCPALGSRKMWENLCQRCDPLRCLRWPAKVSMNHRMCGHTSGKSRFETGRLQPGRWRHPTWQLSSQHIEGSFKFKTCWEW